MRETSLKPDRNGVIWRNLGWKKTRTGQRSQHKFNLGTNRKEAQSRLALLKRLWQSIQEREGEDATWGDFTLRVGTVIAGGKTEVKVEHRRMRSYIPGVEWCYVDDATYARSINDLQIKYPFVKFIPESPDAYQRGVEKLATLVAANLDRLDEEVSRQKKSLTDLGKPIPGEMLHDALNDYIEWIKVEYFDRAEGHISDSGMTKIRQVKTIRKHLENCGGPGLADSWRGGIIVPCTGVSDERVEEFRGPATGIRPQPSTVLG